MCMYAINKDHNSEFLQKSIRHRLCLALCRTWTGMDWTGLGLDWIGMEWNGIILTDAF